MQSNNYQRRFYRDWVKAKDLQILRLRSCETDIQILSDIVLDEKFLKKQIQIYRKQIEEYISKNRQFLTSLKPLEVDNHAAKIIQDMQKSAQESGVGPMAAVAGAIAQYLGQDILSKGAKEVIIENGGDIFLKIKKARNVSIYAGESKLSNKLFLKINPQESSLGICTSSSSVGHSLSFGCADAVTILAKDAISADALATATGNLIKSAKDLKKAIDFVKKKESAIGAVIILKNKLASWGKIEFV